MFMIYSIIIPCRNEGKNVERMVQRITRSLGARGDYEIVFVDDSSDQTPGLLEALSKQFGHVRFRHRESGGGLSSAVLEGFDMAQGEWFIVMDADAQHPPESLPAVVSAIERAEGDLIVPSRFVAGGHDGGLNPWRKFVSWTARTLARVALRRVWKIKDPTSGFFAVRRATAYSRPLNPVGWKILLELLVRSDYERVAEIPYSFEARDAGSSKFGLREQGQYLRHIVRLIRSSEQDLRFWKFCMVGASGVIVNGVVYMALVQLNMQITLAYAAAAMTAMTNNFIWNNLFTWKHSKTDPTWFRFTKFIAVSISGLFLSSGVVALTHHAFDFHYLLAGLTGILVSTGWNFFLHSVWTFKQPSSRSLSASEQVVGDRIRPGA